MIAEPLMMLGVYRGRAGNDQCGNTGDSKLPHVNLL
jgi:hypothetical protein